MRLFTIALTIEACIGHARRLQASVEHLQGFMPSMPNPASIATRASSTPATAQRLPRVLRRNSKASMTIVSSSNTADVQAKRVEKQTVLNTSHHESRERHRAQGQTFHAPRVHDWEAKHRQDQLEAKRTQLLSELASVNRALDAEFAKSQEVPPAIGSKKSVFDPSFGYLSRSAGVYTDTISANGSNVPSSAIDLAMRNFRRELPEFIRALSGTQQIEDPQSEEAAAFRAKLDKLVLDNDKVWAREKMRPAVQAPLILLIPYYVLCWVLDVAFDGRPIARFWFLETVARIPYFSYVSALHLYESLGWWRRSAETKRVHFAEEWNEFHHLLTMEALGGDQLWQDRFLAQHAAIAYYWVLVGMWLLSPSLSYKFSELIEAHAVDTYAEFVNANHDLLADLPAPRVSRQYYNGPDLYLFDEFQTARPRGSRRPSCETLLDVFTNIRDDEAEHVATMVACQDPKATVTAPKWEAALITTAVLGAAVTGIVGPDAISDAMTSALDAVSGEALLETGMAGVVGAAAIVDKVITENSAEEIASGVQSGAEASEAVAGGLAAVAATAKQALDEIFQDGEVLVKDPLKKMLGRFLE